MKRIWQVTWYNDDFYGPYDTLKIMVQGEEMDEKKAVEVAMNYANGKVNDISIEKHLAKRYKQMEAEELTNEEVLGFHIERFA